MSQGSLDTTYKVFLTKVAMSRGPHILLAKAAGLEAEAARLELSPASAGVLAAWWGRGGAAAGDAAAKVVDLLALLVQKYKY